MTPILLIEAERRHLAHELHNDLSLQLVNIKLMLDVTPDLPASVLHRSLENIRKTVDRLLDHVNKLAYELHPVLIEQMGLVPAVLWYIERYTRQTDIRVGFEHGAIAGKQLDRLHEIALFRIIQEAFYNVARHAQTLALSLSLSAKGSTLHLQVVDRGRGFRVEGIQGVTESRGLQLMQEYARAVQGKVVIESTPGSGTKILGVFPQAFIEGDTELTKEVEKNPAITSDETVNQEQGQRLNLDLTLSQREQEILRLILADFSYKDISQQLYISPRTVEKHRANIMHKLGLRSHKELFLFAVQHRLIEPE